MRRRGYTLFELVIAMGLMTLLLLVLLPLGWQLGQTFGLATEYASDLDHGVAAADRIAALVRSSAEADTSSPSVLMLKDARGASTRVLVDRGLVVAERSANGSPTREALGAAAAVSFRSADGLVFFDVQLPRRTEGAQPAALSSCAALGAR